MMSLFHFAIPSSSCSSLLQLDNRSLIIAVMDSERGECVDPGENGAILDAGGVEGPGPPGGGKNGQLASDSERG